MTSLSQVRKRRNAAGYRSRKWVRAVAALGALGLLWVGYVQWTIHSVQGQPPKTRAEVAIVLGAALWNDAPSPALRERLERAIELYRSHSVDRLIVTGGLDRNGSTIPEGEGMKRYLTERGIPPDRIVVEPEATSTYENLLFSLRIMEREGWTSAVIVTHQYHGARALDIARFIGMEDVSVSLMDSNVMWMPWHKARETLAFTKWQLDKLLIRVGWFHPEPPVLKR